ncbi:hypothetical protein DPMN_006328 [Dreissena polymorpha]|uniref:Uncharacterized protein n=1 Tax=Dreissena polymorpha TaxID=45954 RepID=A0A9D4RXA5_DREPO|nr:hypothetical protein DPMN_006328 [Dreissena polymorpha]
MFFSLIWTIFDLVRNINKTNVLTNHVFQRTRTIFELNSHWTKNVTSRVLTCLHFIHRAKTAPPLDIDKTKVLTKKTAPPTGGHIGHEILELDLDIIGTNLLTKFHEDRTRNVASIECLQPNVDGRTTDERTTDKDRSQKLT